MKIRNRLLVQIGAFLFTRTCRLIFLTVRIERRSASSNLPEHGLRRCVFSIWHDSVILPLFGGHANRLAVLTSRHHDGCFVTAVLNSLGIATVRGSTTRGGVAAMREMMDKLDNTHLAITPDGPRGPRRKMSKGIVFLSSRTGSPIVPVGCSCSRGLRIKGSWTDLVIPAPFSRVVLVSGSPVSVPRDLPIDALEPYVHDLQDKMAELDQTAKRCLPSAA